MMADGDGIICFKDGAIWDGPYSEIRLLREEDGTFQLSHISGKTSSSAREENLLETGLECNIHGVLAYCLNDFTPRTAVSFHLVETTLLHSINPNNQPAKQKPNVEIVVRSIGITEPIARYGFPLDLRTSGTGSLIGGCREIQ